MRLKRVRLFGFKTFADRTDLNVDGDVIAVVGPNGCGKSNLVDAILWGLGEGAAKSLRAESGQDVIFGGSAKRKPLGYAEVALLFDNEDGSLPVATSEVTVTRRLTRAGDSEYRINGAVCRLKDVAELLADSGLGRAGYAIVGQRDIDLALAASPDERRAWVDEAAGVMRYRTRKLEAARRLGSARLHVERVGDLIREIESQRAPLQDEAEVARAYKSLLEQLKRCESGLLVVELAAAVRDFEEAHRRIEAASTLASKERLVAEAMERELTEATERVSQLESRLDALRSKQHEALAAFERAESAVRLGEQKLKTLDELESGLSSEDAGVQRRVEEAEAELASAREEARIEAERMRQARVLTAGAGEEARALAAELQRIEAEIESARRLHERKLRLEAEASMREERVREIRRELEGIEASRKDVDAALSEAKTAWEARMAAVSESRVRIGKLRAELEALTAQESSDAEEARKFLAHMAQLEGKRRGIEATISAHEGLRPGARAVIQAVEAGKLSGSYEPLGESIEASREHLPAVEAALADAADDLITGDEADAWRGITTLKESSLGRTTFRPLTLAKAPPEPKAYASLLRRKEVVAELRQVVRCNARLRPVIDALLAGAVLVRTFDDALAVAKFEGWSRIVTSDGEVIRPCGAITGGHNVTAAHGVLHRRGELSEIAEAIAGARSSLAQIEARIRDRQRLQNRLEVKIASAEVKAQTTLSEAEEARDWLKSIEEELAAMEKSSSKLQSELSKLEAVEPQEVGDVDLETLEAKRTRCLKRLASRSADAEQSDEMLQEAERRLAAAELRLQQAERRLKSALESQESRARRAASLGPERLKVQAEIQAALRSREAAAHAQDVVSAELREAIEERRIALEKGLSLTDRIKSARQNAEKSQESAHRADLDRAKADAKRASLAQRLLEEYGLTEEEAVAAAPRIELPKDAAAVAARLRRELKAMGDVNVGAIDAFERLTQRYDELQRQREDIQSGIREVEASIRELDDQTRGRFRATFEKVQVAFAETFQTLFQGGEATLRLSNPDDELASGIEIDVLLPGKRRQKLELLSGGERSLCAMAFLFALLKVKPSPLVVLDEVDAPLDGRNVERFVALLHHFAGTTQFIVITHNPVTIASSPVWIGVTMQEPGVSTLAPARFPMRSEQAGAIANPRETEVRGAILGAQPARAASS